LREDILVNLFWVVHIYLSNEFILIEYLNACNGYCMCRFPKGMTYKNCWH